MRYGAVADQYVRIHSTKDSNYAHSATGAALIVDGGATFAKKVYIASSQDVDTTYNGMQGALTVDGGSTFTGKVFIFNSTDSNYATVAGALVVNGGANFAKKVYLRDSTDSNYATVAGSLVTAGGVYITKKLYVASTQDSNYATLAGSLVTAGGLYVTKKTYIADTTDSNYSTLAGALVVAGGANFGKKVYLKDTTDSTSYTTGSLVTAGGMAITKQLRVQGVTTHGGNVVSDTNATDNIGVTATRWKEGYFSALVSVGAASTSYSTATSHNSYIGPGTFYSNVHSATGGFYTYLDGTEYGRFYILTKGTAGTATTYTNPDDETQTITGYTGNTQGHTILVLGNNKAVGTNGSSYSSPGTAGTANNSRGRIRLYGTGTTYTDLYSNPNGSRNVYLPYSSTANMYLAWTSAANTAEGSGTKPVYAAAGGKLTASTSTVGSSTKPIYLSSGTLTASSSTVGSATKPIYLSSGTITAGTYELKATVNAGTASRLAYYSGANAIEDAGSLETNGAYIHILNTGDVGGTTAGTSAPFAIGTLTAQHLEMDNNEILSKSNGTTPSTLFLQDGTGVVSVAGTGGLYVTTASSSWLEGHNATQRGIKISDANNTGSYWPWLKQTNTSSKLWWGMGTLNTYWTLMCSATTRTENGRDTYLNFYNDGHIDIGSSISAARYVNIAASASKDAGFRVTGTQYSISLMIGSGNVNRGIYDHAKGWLAYWDANSVGHFIGAIATPNHGTADPNSSTPGYGTAGALYFKRLS